MITASEIIAHNRAAITDLFYQYGIAEPVNEDTVQMAIDEEPEFIYDLVETLGTDNVLSQYLVSYAGEENGTDHNGTAPKRTPQEKAELATNIIGGLFNSGMGIWSDVNAARNGNVRTQPQPMYTPAPQQQNKNLIYGAIGIAVVVVILLVVVLMKK